MLNIFNVLLIIALLVPLSVCFYLQWTTFLRWKQTNAPFWSIKNTNVREDNFFEGESLNSIFLARWNLNISVKSAPPPLSPHYVPQFLYFQIFAFMRALVCLYSFRFIIWIATFSALWKRMSGLEVWEQQVPVWLIWLALAGKRNLGESELLFSPQCKWRVCFFQCNFFNG